MKLAMPIATLSLLLAGCASPAAENAEAPAPKVAEKTPPAPAAIDAAKVALRAEPKIKDLAYNPADTVQWNVGVLDDGSRRVGYAQYVCEVLAEKHALAGRTHVRVVDIAKVEQGSDFRDANLGHVICETGDIVDA